jgi:hypothetical protein
MVNSGEAARILAHNHIRSIHFAQDVFDRFRGFPQGFTLSKQYTFAGILFPLKDGAIFPLRRLFKTNGDYNPEEWKKFSQFRNMKGPTRNFEGVNQSGIFSFMEFALWIPENIIPAKLRSEHLSTMDAITKGSMGTTAIERQGKQFIVTRIAMRFTVEFHQLVSSTAYKNAMNEGCIPVLVLQNFIIQRSSEKYIISSQDHAPKSKLVLLGKINNDLKFDNLS